MGCQNFWPGEACHKWRQSRRNNTALGRRNDQWFGENSSTHDSDLMKWYRELYSFTGRYRGLILHGSECDLCTAPDWKTERQRSEVCKEGNHEDFMKIFISFLVEVDSVRFQRIGLHTSEAFPRKLFLLLCHIWCLFSEHAPLPRTWERCKDKKYLLLLIRVHYEVVVFASQQSAI